MKCLADTTSHGCSYYRQSSFDQGDSPRVASPRERRDQPDLHNFEGQFLRNHSLAQRKHVAVVVFARQPRGVEIPAQRAANASDFIRDDCFAVARPPHHNTPRAPPPPPLPPPRLPRAPPWGGWDKNRWVRRWRGGEGGAGFCPGGVGQRR